MSAIGLKRRGELNDKLLITGQFKHFVMARCKLSDSGEQKEEKLKENYGTECVSKTVVY